jgi:Holliday junction DNA helicase RuvB
MAERPLAETLNRPDEAFELTVRPGRFADFVGQAKIRERLELSGAAASGRGEPMDHVLLCGPPGLGKTTLAYILGAAMGANVKATSGPVLAKPRDLAGC